MKTEEETGERLEECGETGANLRETYGFGIPHIARLLDTETDALNAFYPKKSDL